MANQSLRRPGGETATRPLHFIWLVDGSGSMTVKGKIQALNHAVREAIPHMQRVAADNTDATILVRAVWFATGAGWHIAQPTPVESFRWTDVRADEGVTDLGEALRLVADEMAALVVRQEKVLRPVLVLLSDGQPTDDFEGGLQALLAQPLGRLAVRIAIAIGEDADQEKLQEFIADPERRVLQASNPEMLTSYINFVSTAVLKTVSSPIVGAPVPQPPPQVWTDNPVW